MDKCKAIFYKTPSTDFYEEKVPIKLSNNDYAYVYNRVYDDPELQQCHLMYNTAETVQALARLRLIHDSGKKDLYIFSNESLYEHITITDLISIKDLLVDHQYDQGIQKIMDIGYCRDKRSDLMNEDYVNFSDQQARNISENKDLLLSSGLLEYKMINVNSNERFYFVSIDNLEPFEQYYEEMKKIRLKTKK